MAHSLNGKKPCHNDFVSSQINPTLATHSALKLSYGAGCIFLQAYCIQSRSYKLLCKTVQKAVKIIHVSLDLKLTLSSANNTEIRTSVHGLHQTLQADAPVPIAVQGLAPSCCNR